MAIYSRKFIKAGSEVLDGESQLVATFVNDVMEGDQVRSTDIRYADGRQPSFGEMAPTVLIDFIRRC